MKLLNWIVDSVWRFRKAADGRLWLGLELVAKAILAHSGHHVMPAHRHRKPAHSEAWRKGSVIFIPGRFPGLMSWH
jgi:hypothetical protein